MSKCYYLERIGDTNRFRKCYGSCDHPNHEHRAGTCWHVVGIDDKGEEKYCKCVQNIGNIKPFVLTGKIEPDPEDWMIPVIIGNDTHLVPINR